MVRAQTAPVPSPVSRQRPSFHGQNGSATSSTTSTGVRYVRAASAAPTSTGRTNSDSRSTRPHRRMSPTRCGSASSTGRVCTDTDDVRSIPKRKRHSAAYTTGSSASTCRTRTTPAGPASSQTTLTAKRA